MPLESDLTLNVAKFARQAVSKKTSELNGRLTHVMRDAPAWFEVGAPEYRRMRWDGETPLPKPTLLPQGKKIEIASREAGRMIPCRVFAPEDADGGRVESKGAFLHVHGGGWVLQSEEYQDPLLKYLADTTSLTVVSVGYRLAPEHPFPDGPQDCLDIAEYLVDHAESEYGGPLKMAGGESAGAHLATLTVFRLLFTRPIHAFSALLLSYGAYDLTLLPQARNYQHELVLTPTIMAHYLDAFLPGMSTSDRARRQVSPFYEDIPKMLDLSVEQRSWAQGNYSGDDEPGTLPPALFAVGTDDMLLDDSVIMAAKWAMSGAQAVLKVYSGACHAFTLFEPAASEGSGGWRRDVAEFVRDVGV